MDAPVWTDVPGFRGYLVSDTGLVHSVWSGRVVSQRLMRGYPTVTLRRDGGSFRKLVHQLVCEAFHGPCPEGATLVRHLDGDKANNHASNLAWGTAHENARDRREHRSLPAGPETFGGMLRLQREAVGLTQAELAQRMRVSQAQVSHWETGRIRLFATQFGRWLGVINPNDAWRLRAMDRLSAEYRARKARAPA